jgi:integrase
VSNVRSCFASYGLAKPLQKVSAGILVMITPELNRATDSHVLTVLNTPSAATDVENFATWLLETGASRITAENYGRAVVRWLGIMQTHSSLRPAQVWLRWSGTPAMKRITGYALRRWREYNESILGLLIDIGVPSRLPAASAPRPRPISDQELRLLRLKAKSLLPVRIGNSFRVWLAMVEELGLRRSESEIGWDQVQWTGSISVFGKTGRRELPLSRRMLRLLSWLRRQNPTYPWIGAHAQKLSGGVLYNIFQAVSSASGLLNLRPHLLRHRRLTLLCRSSLGTNPLLVLAFAGHSHIGSLHAYYDVSLEEKRALMEAA